MSSSVVAAAALLGGAFAQDPPMWTRLCEGTGGGKFNPENNMGGQTCAEMLEMFSWDDVAFTDDECSMTMPAFGITLQAASVYMQYGCCENGMPTGEAPTGLCGDHFPVSMCAEAGAFSPMEESGEWDCDFNEPLPEAECEYEGKSGWVDEDGTAECIPDEMFKNVPKVEGMTACGNLGGNFKTVRCWEVALWVKEMVPGETIQEQCTQLNENDLRSEVQERRMMIQKFAMQCCLSTDSMLNNSMLNNCEPTPTYPPPVGGGTCGQVSADAIRKARAKGYEPQRCAGNDDGGFVDDTGNGSEDPCADAEDVEACRFELVVDGGDPCAHLADNAEYYEQCQIDSDFGRD